MTFYAQAQTPATSPNVSHSLPEPTERKDLQGLTKKDLKTLVISLRKEQEMFKDENKANSDTINELTEARPSLVRALRAVDTLLALNQSNKIE